MRIYLSLITLLFLLPSKSYCDISSSVEKKLEMLDKCLKDKKSHDIENEKHIAQYKEKLKKARSYNQKYKACISLYDKYKSYKYDSAYIYANHSLLFARKLGNREYQVESECAIAFCLLSSGLYKEAFDRIENVRTDGISSRYRKIYYQLLVSLNYAIADYNHKQPYHNEYVANGNVYTDSLLAMLPSRSSDRYFSVALRLMKENKYDDSRATFIEMLKDKSIDVHTKAIVTSCVGWMYWKDGNEDVAMQYLADAAICDVLTSTKETTALRGLAELLYKHGDIQRATDYVQHSLDDANFYGARQRKIEVGEILPIIEQDRYDILQRQRNILVVTVSIISFLVVVIVFAFFYLYRQKRSLQQARNMVNLSNIALQKVNSQLREANNIKNEYIGNSFYINSEFIDKMEKLSRMIDRKIKTRQYDDLSYSLRESVLNKERDNMFTVFDATFLKIFPTFVEQYNSLFPENERRQTDKETTLTTEMRIFALIRLGITESERIANFLNKSVHTINTYKTRVKNKSLVENDLFEKRIMQIGSEM